MSAPGEIVAAQTSDRLTSAAQLLLDAARAANTEGAHFVAGREYVAEPMGLAVQALFMADVWDAPGRKITLDGERTLQRIRGLGFGVGCCLGALPPAITTRLTIEILAAMDKGEKQRRSAQQGLDL